MTYIYLFFRFLKCNQFFLLCFQHFIFLLNAVVNKINLGCGPEINNRMAVVEKCTFVFTHNRNLAVAVVGICSITNADPDIDM